MVPFSGCARDRFAQLRDLTSLQGRFALASQNLAERPDVVDAPVHVDQIKPNAYARSSAQCRRLAAAWLCGLRVTSALSP